MPHSGYRYLLLIATITGLFSCTMVSKPQAVAMNNTLVQINDSLFLMGRQFGTMIGDVVATKQFSSLTPVRQQFESFIDSSKARLLVMKDAYGSGALRKSEIDLLDVEKHMVIADFAPFERLMSFATLPEVSAMFDKIKQDSKMESEKMGAFKREQKLYARKNGFELAPNGMAQ